MTAGDRYRIARTLDQAERIGAVTDWYARSGERGTVWVIGTPTGQRAYTTREADAFACGIDAMTIAGERVRELTR